MPFTEISVRQIDENLIRLINERWALITAGDESKVNTMTISWGTMGVLWNKEVFTAFVRPTRYTYEFLEREEGFSICFFPEEFRSQLTLCGRKSGREVDKVAACGFTTSFMEGIPYFEQADLVLFCRKIYVQDMDPAGFLDPSIHNFYHDDYNRIYVGEILKVLKK